MLADERPKYLHAPQASLHERDLFTQIFINSVREVGADVDKIKEDTYVIEFTKEGSAIAISVYTSFQVAGYRNWLVIDNETILIPKASNQSADGDGPWEMRFEPLSGSTVQKLLAAKSLTLQYLKAGQNEEAEHKFPMERFSIAYTALTQDLSRPMPQQ